MSLLLTPYKIELAISEYVVTTQCITKTILKSESFNSKLKKEELLKTNILQNFKGAAISRP